MAGWFSSTMQISVTFPTTKRERSTRQKSSPISRKALKLQISSGARGWEEMHITDWIIPPGYEADTNRLAWGVGLSRAGGTGSNYDVRLLGRTGVMSATLSCKPEAMTSLVTTLKTLLAGFEYNAGNKYGEWRAGDKVAAYGLTGLITGAAAVAAAKSGLLAKIGVALAKMGKAIIIGIAVIGAGVWKLLFGNKTNATLR